MGNHQQRRHSAYLELVYLETDGELTPSEIRELHEHVPGCPECRTVRNQLGQLTAALDETRIEPHPELARRVLENLPPAAWEMRRPASWRVAAMAFFGLLAAAYALNYQSEPLGEALPLIGTLAAMAELLRSAALAGAGLLAASWSGVGLALGDVLSRSRVGFAALGAFVLGVDYLFLSYLLRLSRREAAAASELSDPGGRSR